MYILRSDIPYEKYPKIQASSDPYFLIYDPCRGKHRYDSIHIPKNMDQRKPAFQHIRKKFQIRLTS